MIQNGLLSHTARLARDSRSLPDPRNCVHAYSLPCGESQRQRPGRDARRRLLPALAPRQAKFGGLLGHKSSHHFDLVNWWLQDRPERAYASGGLRFYGVESSSARGDIASPERGTHDGDHSPFELDLRGDPHLGALYLQAESADGYMRDLDVFGPGITIEDNRAVIVDYRRGAALSYSLNAHSPWEGYRVALNGTLGRAELDVVERGMVLVGEGLHPGIDPSVSAKGANGGLRPDGDHLLVQRHWEPAVEVPIDADAGAHGGGDQLMLSDVFLGGTDDPLGHAADWADGVWSIAVGVAGNQSLERRLPVRVADLGVRVLAEDA